MSTYTGPHRQTHYDIGAEVFVIEVTGFNWGGLVLRRGRVSHVTPLKVRIGDGKALHDKSNVFAFTDGSWLMAQQLRDDIEAERQRHSSALSGFRARFDEIRGAIR